MRKTGKIPQFGEFRLQLIREILQEHSKDLGTGRRTSAGEHPKRLISLQWYHQRLEREQNNVNALFVVNLFERKGKDLNRDLNVLSVM